MAKKGLFWVWGGSDVSTISPHLRKPTPAPGLGIEHPNIGPLMYHHKLKPARGEWEFPFPVIPGKTILKCQFPSRGILFFPFPFPGKGSFGRELYSKHHAAERWDLEIGSNTAEKFEKTKLRLNTQRSPTCSKLKLFGRNMRVYFDSIISSNRHQLHTFPVPCKESFLASFTIQFVCMPAWHCQVCLLTYKEGTRKMFF